MVEFKLQNYMQELEDIFKIRDYAEWEADYTALKSEGKKLWEGTGLPNDIREGWHKAAKENKLFAFGPYSVPLDVVEAIEDDTRQMLRNAGITKSKSDDGTISATYVQIIKDKVKRLEEDLRAKQKQIDTLIATIGEMRSKGTKEPFKEEKAADDEVELF